MAHYSKLFEKVPVEVQNQSGFNLSHENLFTAYTGTLTPAFVYDCIPNTHLSLNVSAQIQLPPMSSDFYGKIDAVFESFFIPYRLLYGGWQELITHPVKNAVYPSGTQNAEKANYLPYFLLGQDSIGPCSLYDYLGGKTNNPNGETVVNPLRFLAYHKIWDDWYRNSFVQAPAFSRERLYDGEYSYAGNLPYLSFSGSSATRFSGLLSDSHPLESLRQRNWSKDYFTSSTPLPQAGTPAQMSTTVNNDLATFSWSQLSSMNVLQRWMTRNNLAGYRYSDQILARFGCLPPDSIMDRSIYLGRCVIPVYTKSVYQQGENSTVSSNPFSSIGTKFGSSMGVGNGRLIDKYHAKEHGVFMVLFSLVPRAYYSTGTDRQFYQSSISDFPDPDFANLGDQPIYQFELKGSYYGTPDNEKTFGYTQRDSHYKYKDDQVHGLLRDGSSLSSFALQRSFNTVQQLSSEFLSIPRNYLDQVTATGISSSQYGCWVDSYFDCVASMPLPAYSIPTLTDPKDVHTITISKGGRTL